MKQSEYTIFHNPRCSKSRLTLEILKENGIEPIIFEYLKTPMKAEQLRGMFQALGKKPKDVLRVNEDDYKRLSINFDDDDAVIDAIISFPKILERPIVIKDNEKTAVIGRPPENVLKIIPS